MSNPIANMFRNSWGVIAANSKPPQPPPPQPPPPSSSSPSPPQQQEQEQQQQEGRPDPPSEPQSSLLESQSSSRSKDDDDDDDDDHDAALEAPSSQSSSSSHNDDHEEEEEEEDDDDDDDDVAFDYDLEIPPVMIRSYEEGSSSLLELDGAEQEDQKEEVFAVVIDTMKNQRPTDIRFYKEVATNKVWFDEHVSNNTDNKNPRNICAKSLVAELCGIQLNIYYRKNHEEEDEGECSSKSRRRGGGGGDNNNNHTKDDIDKNHDHHHRRRRRRHYQKRNVRPVNKIATMLTFDPNTGLYNHFIRGKAYVTLGDGEGERAIISSKNDIHNDTTTSRHLGKRVVWSLQELIRDHKDLYHKFGADFSREGQIQLLKACVQYKKGKWMPRSLYSMAVSNHEGGISPAGRWNAGHLERGIVPSEAAQYQYTDDDEDEEDETMRRSSASHWFINSYPIDDSGET